MTNKVMAVEGEITTEDGSAAKFLIRPDGGWFQWGVPREKLGETQPVISAMADALVDEDLLAGETADIRSPREETKEEGLSEARMALTVFEHRPLMEWVDHRKPLKESYWLECACGAQVSSNSTLLSLRRWSEHAASEMRKAAER